MIHTSTFTSDNLPSWFQKPRTTYKPQDELFSDELEEVLTVLCVSGDELSRWQDRGWISFDPRSPEALSYWQVNEIRFVRDVVRSGLSDAQIDHLFARLPRPMDFDPGSVAYSFTLGWVMGVPRPEPEEFIQDHLDRLAKANDAVGLLAIKEMVERLLERIPTPEEEEDE